MMTYYKDYLDKLKTQSLDELKRQRTHHFESRSLSSTDLYELTLEEINRRERLKERKEDIKWTKLTFAVAFITLIFYLVELMQR